MSSSWQVRQNSSRSIKDLILYVEIDEYVHMPN